MLTDRTFMNIHEVVWQRYAVLRQQLQTADYWFPLSLRFMFTGGLWDVCVHQH